MFCSKLAAVLKMDGVNIKPELAIDDYSHKLIGYCDVKGDLRVLIDGANNNSSMDSLFKKNNHFDHLIKKHIKTKSHLVMLQFTNTNCLTDFPILVGVDMQCPQTVTSDYKTMISMILQALRDVGIKLVCSVVDCEPQQLPLLSSFPATLLNDYIHVCKCLAYGLSKNSKMISVGKIFVGLDKIHDRSLISLSRIDKVEF